MKRHKVLLKDIAYEKIKEQILREDDEYISENFLVESLQMSRTPIREALQRLQHEGFIKILPNQGIAITDLSVKEMNDITNYRIVLETASLRQAVHLLNKEHFDHLEQLIQLQVEAVTQNDMLLYLQNDVEFHLYLVKVVGNEFFTQAIEHVGGRLFRLRRMIKSNPQPLFDRIQEHKRIIDLLKDKEIDLAVKELEDHMKSGKIFSFSPI
jgi:DNA-binding GntR family transcriptional regulator